MDVIAICIDIINVNCNNCPFFYFAIYRGCHYILWMSLMFFGFFYALSGVKWMSFYKR